MAVSGGRWSRYASCVAWGAILPLIATVAAVVTILDPPDWLSPSPAWSGLAPVALLYSTGLLIAAAPLLGVAFAGRGLQAGARSWPAARRIVAMLSVGAGAFAGSAAVWTTALDFLAGEGVSTPLLTGHLVQGAVFLAVALGSAMLACRLANPLDAAGWSVALTWLASFGMLGAGTMVERLPRPLADWALGAGPLMAVATAGQIDVLRFDVVYQISPLAHVQVLLPSWPMVVAAYLLVSAACAIGLVRLSSEPHTASPQRIL